MKKHFIPFLFLLIYLPIFAEEKPIEITTTIEKVTVFLNGAEISHTANFSLSQGKSLLVIKNISTQVNSKSIQASVSGNTRILSITTETDFLTPHENIKKIQLLKDSLALLSDKIHQFNTEMNDIEDERKMILSNQSRLGNEGGVTVVELQNASNFFKKRLKEISAEKFDIQLKVRKLSVSKTRIEQQLAQDNTLREIPKNYILLLVDSKSNQSVSLELSYAVTDAGWAPKYNIRAESIEKPIQFEYLANVFNNTGIDWKNVSLTLSTGDPFKSLTLPTMETWTLNTKRSYQSYNEGYLNQKRAMSNNSPQQDFQQQTNFEQNDVEVSAITVDFKIAEKYSIPSDNKPYLIEVNTYELQASYQYYTIPKVECEAFLMANVVDWEKVNIIDSYANIYYNGKYVGESFISTEVANDTLSFSMGRDSKINISRVKKEDFNKQKWIGLNRTESFEYEIAVRNTYNTPIQIEIIDQVPISQESDIEVTIKEISKAEHNLQNGQLKWKLSIEPKTTKKLITAFSVKYPKNKNVAIRQKRKVASPKYF